MWRTPEGNRTLTGAEGRLLRESMAWVAEQIEEDFDVNEPWEYDVPLFDSLPWQQKLALLAEVGEALFRADVPVPPQTAVNESAIAALYRNIFERIEFEIDASKDDYEWDDGWEWDHMYWRKLVLAAAEQLDMDAFTLFPEDEDDEEEPIVAESEEIADWELLVDGLRDHVLWDEDWLMADDFLDSPPELCELQKTRLTIDDDYFTATAPDARDEELPRIRESIRDLCGNKSDR